MSTTVRGITIATSSAEQPAEQRVLRQASLVVLAALGLIALSAIVAAAAPASALPIDAAQQLLATGGGTVAVLAMWRAAPMGQRWLAGALSAGLALAGAGMVASSLLPIDAASIAGPAGALFLVAITLVGGALLRAFTLDLDRTRLNQIVLDGLVVVAAGICLLAPVWFGVIATANGNLAIHVAVPVALVLVCGPGAGLLALFDRRLQPGMWGPYAALAGLLVAGLSWLAWLVDLARETTSPVSITDWGYSVAVLLIAWGAVTWDRAPALSPWFDRWATGIVDVFPLAAVALCVVMMIVVDGHQEAGMVQLAAAAVVTFGLARQLHLVRRERISRTAERDAAAHLAREIRHRALVLGSLANFETGPAAEDTAQRICDRATGVGNRVQAAIIVFEPDGSGYVLAEAGPARPADSAGRVQPPEFAGPYRERLLLGAWSEPVNTRTHPHARALYAAGLKSIASAPIMFGDRLLGGFSVATAGGDDPELAEERLTAAREFGLIAGAILGASLDERVRVRGIRASIAAVIEGWAFKTVFQPIVDLDSTRVVGHEALTRFEDGMRPDRRFEEAASVGMGIELERATLESAIRSAVRLPHDTYVSLNASPELASDLELIEALVARAPCPVVLEITERDAVKSYTELRAALGQLRKHVRIAVDDVGAGYAGLRHILEIEPDLLKLDIALVRDVDSDAAKRALIGSIVTFGREAGCRIVAEGIETSGEARTLRRLGVQLGQGFFFGRPERIDQIAVDGWIEEVIGDVGDAPVVAAPRPAE